MMSSMILSGYDTKRLKTQYYCTLLTSVFCTVYYDAGQISPPLVCTNKVLLAHSVALIYVWPVCFHAALSWQNECLQQRPDGPQTLNLYYLALYRKKLAKVCSVLFHFYLQNYL